ncbi:MAG: hypothetical protein GKR89_11930 [Candidatus Latescibacteria bacterium]|nr:hypothetical protein [Candidatus Latescibacterota bacterium]
MLKPAGLVLAVAAATVLYIWKKVEWDQVVHQFSLAQQRIEQLEEEAAQLQAGIAQGKKPGTIQELARRRLGMDYPETGSKSDLHISETAGE